VLREASHLLLREDDPALERDLKDPAAALPFGAPELFDRTNRLSICCHNTYGLDTN